MDHFDINAITGNAYRTLGLRADATQEEIDSAARGMRIWDDAAMIPATANDAQWLGPVQRSGPDIEKAVARLADPEVRVQERLWWFWGSPQRGAEAGEQVGPAGRHDAALAHLHQQLQEGAKVTNRWEIVLSEFVTLARSDECREWMVAAENAGDFEKRSSAGEVAAAQGRMAGRIAMAMVSVIDAKLGANDFATAGHLVGVMRAYRGAEEYAMPEPGGGAAERALNRMEDVATERCAEGMEEIDAAWKTRQVNIMRRACDGVLARYGTLLEPLIGEIDRRCDEEDGRRQRVRAKGVGLMVHLADAYVAIKDIYGEERALKAASLFAMGTAMEGRVRARLEKVSANFRRKPGLNVRQSGGGDAMARWNPTGKGLAARSGLFSRPVRGGMFILVMVVWGLIRLMLGPSSPPVSTYDIPSYTVPTPPKFEKPDPEVMKLMQRWEAAASPAEKEAIIHSYAEKKQAATKPAPQ